MVFDTIIIGSGIAGLYTAYQLVKAGHNNICIFEKSKRPGGRIYTHCIPSLHTCYEAGAGRIASTHKHTLSLIDELDLSKYLFKLPKKKLFVSCSYPEDTYKLDDGEKLDFDFLIKRVISSSKKFSKSFLRQLSFHQLFIHVLSPGATQYLFDSFGYVSEIMHLNAYDAIRMFRDDFSPKQTYMAMSGGLSRVIEALVEYLEENGVNISYESRITNIRKATTFFHVTKNDTTVFKTRHVVCAVPPKALLELSALRSMRRQIMSVQPHSLMRVYAIYPRDDKTERVWFEGMPRITTNASIRYIIPINPEKGLIMISYTDTHYADYIKHVDDAGKQELRDHISKDLQRLFPKISIPEPSYIKCHYWNQGAHFWKPGFSSSLSKKMVEPLPYDCPNLYICGEAFSTRQAWIEGSIETARKVTKRIIRRMGI